MPRWSRLREPNPGQPHCAFARGRSIGGRGLPIDRCDSTTFTSKLPVVRPAGDGRDSTSASAVEPNSFEPVLHSGAGEQRDGGGRSARNRDDVAAAVVLRLHPERGVYAQTRDIDSDRGRSHEHKQSSARRRKRRDDRAAARLDRSHLQVEYGAECLAGGSRKTCITGDGTPCDSAAGRGRGGGDRSGSDLVGGVGRHSDKRQRARRPPLTMAGVVDRPGGCGDVGSDRPVRITVTAATNTPMATAIAQRGGCTGALPVSRCSPSVVPPSESTNSISGGSGTLPRFA